MVLNNSEQENIIKKFKVPINKISLCHNGVDTAFYSPISQECARTIIGLKQNRKYILFVGRLSDFHKGVSVLLKSLKLIVNQNKNVSLLIIGTGPDERKLKDLSKELGLEKIVNFLGHVEKNLPIYYNASDIVVVPSLFEAFGTVNIEAMACGKSVIASNVGGIKEIITDGKTGLLIPPGDFLKLSEKILFLLQNPEYSKKLGIAARKRIEQYFSYEALGKKLKQIYNQCE